MLSGDWIPRRPARSRRAALAPARASSASAARPRRRSGRSATRSDASTRRGASIPYGQPMRNQPLHVLDDGAACRARLGAGRALHRRRSASPAATGATRSGPRASVRAPPGAPASGSTAPATSAATCPDGNIEFLGREDFQVKIARLPHRAGRDRGRPARATARERAAVVAADRRRGAAAGWPATCTGAGRRPASQLRAHLRATAARLHGPHASSWRSTSCR